MNPHSFFLARKSRFAGLAFLTLTLVGGCHGGPKSVTKETRYAMGTRATITLASSRDNSEKKEIFDSAFGRLGEIERKMSPLIPTSLVARINADGSKNPMSVDKELWEVLHQSLLVSNMTGGKFDITVGPLVRLWGFDDVAKTREVPRRGDILSLLQLVNYRNVELDHRRMTVFLKREGMGIDLGGIAKGYAVDSLAGLLLEMGVTQGIVQIGGDLKTLGLRPDHTPWVIGIRHPRDRGRLLGVLDSDGRAVSTSGDYERNFIEEAVMYHHILNPSTGYPARRCQSVTILAESAMRADALATGVFILGPEKGMKLVENLRGVDAVIVDISGKVHLSTGITGRFRTVG